MVSVYTGLAKAADPAPNHAIAATAPRKYLRIACLLAWQAHSRK
jgi:hypothetical protein